MLIDFGLARKYVDEDGKPMAKRTDTAFRGSTTYASVYAHRNEDLSRRDDLWSWFYMLLELVEGELPGWTCQSIVYCWKRDA
jgi:tau tubulin kinase